MATLGDKIKLNAAVDDYIARRFGSPDGGKNPVDDYVKRRFADVKPEQSDDSWGTTIKNRAVDFFGGLLDPVALTLQGFGQDAKSLAEETDRRVNPNGDNPYSSGGALRTVGDVLESAGNFLQIDREPVPADSSFADKSLGDIVTDSSLAYDYFTNPNGAARDLAYGAGNATFFYGLSRLAPQAAAAWASSKILSPAARALGAAGATKLAQLLGSPTTHEGLGEAMRFASTMGPAGAYINASTIIPALREQGLSESEIASRRHDLMLEELPYDVGFSAITGPIVKGIPGRMLGRDASTGARIATNLLTGVPLEAAGGHFSNLEQMILSEKYSGQPYGELFGEHTTAENEAARTGAGMAALFGGYGSYHGARTARAENVRRNNASALSNLIGGTEEIDGNKGYKQGSIYGDFRQKTLDAIDQNEDIARLSYRDAMNEGIIRQWAKDISHGGISDEHFDMMVRAAEKYEVPLEHVVATAMAESMGDPNAISPVGAIGYMQLMPKTANALGVDPYDVEQNIDGGVRYLKQQYDKFGDWDLAHAAYNAGEGALYDANGNFRGIPPYKETQKYVRRIRDDFLGKLPDYDGGNQPRVTEKPQDNGQRRGGNVFGVENYDMPPWGNPDISSLKAGWSNVLPQIGGVLKSMGFDPVITSAGRTYEHQMEINPSAPNSWHIIRENGGDAVDISLAEGGVTPEQSQKVLDYFKSTGLFSEVLYHDAGSGLHLHLGGLNTEALDNVRNSEPSTAQEDAYDNNFSPRQNEVWQLAQYASKRLRDEYKIRLAPELIFKQWQLEDGGDFTHPTRNWGGLKDTAGNFRSFGNDQEYADAYVDDFMRLRGEEINAAADENGMMSEDAFAQVMLDTQYITQSDFDGGYGAGMKAKKVPKSGYSNRKGGKTTSERAGEIYQGRRKPLQSYADYVRERRQSQQQQAETEPETIKPRRVEETKGFNFAGFAKDRLTQAVESQDVDGASFWGKMFDDQDNFIDTKENRAAIQQRYGDELATFSQTANETAQPTQTTQQTTQGTKPQAKQVQSVQPAQNTKVSSVLKDAPVIEAGNKFLEELRATAKQEDADTALKLQAAIQQHDIATIKNILTANNRTITTQQETQPQQTQQAQQTQENVVKNNTTPENVLAQGQQQETAQPAEQTQTRQKNKSAPKTGLEKAIKRAHDNLAKGRSKNAVVKRAAVGRALVFIADHYGVEIPQAEREAIREKGDAKLIEHWKEELMYRGLLPPKSARGKRAQQSQPQPAQETQQEPSLIERAREIVKEAMEAAAATWRDLQQNGMPTARAQRRFSALVNSLPEQEPEATVGTKDIQNTEDNIGDVRQTQEEIQAEEETRNAEQDIANEATDMDDVLFNDDETARETQATSTDFDSLATRARQYQNILLEDGDIKGAQEIEYAIQNRDEEKLRDLPTTRREMQARDERARQAKQDKEAADLQARREADDVAGALAKPSADEFTRKKQGARILSMVDSPWFKEKYGEVELSEPLVRALQAGKRKGIEVAQGRIKDAVRKVRRPTAHSEEKPQSQPETKPKNEPPKQQQTAQRPEKSTPTETRETELLAQAEEQLSDKQRGGEDVASKETTQGGKPNETAESTKTETEESKPAEKDNTKDAESGQTQEEVTKPKAEEKAEPKEAAAKYNESNGKASSEGGADTRITNLVADKDLTPQQKLLKDFAAKLGVPIQFFDNPDGRFHGAFSEGITFLNVNSKKPLGGVFWHESFHWLKANNPELYAKLVDAAGITDAQRKEFLERTGRKDLTTNEEIDEEILADMMDDVAKRTGLLQSIAGKNRGLVERAVQWLKDTMNKFIETFRNPTGRLTTKQAQALAGEFGRIARQLKDADGNAIFRVNNRTGDIEVIGGSKTPNVSREQIQAAAQSPAAKYSIDPNDNSTQSWGRRIQNLATSLTRSKPESKPYNQAITDALSKLTRHKIYYNYNGEKEGNVIVDSIQKVILARHAYRWEELLPVAGKQIAENLGLATTPEMSNYIADWMATGAINNTSPEATAFQKAMRNNPVEAKLLQEVRDTFKTVSNMTAEEKYEASIARNKHADTLWGWVTEKGKGLKDWLGQSISKENLTDDLHPLLQLENRMLEIATPAQAETIKKYFHPYMNARLSRGKAAIADMMIGDLERKMSKEDVQNIRDVLSQIYPNVDFSDFTPLASIVQSVDGDFAGLERFALAKLDKEMYEKLREVDAKGNPKYTPDAFTPSQSEADADAVIKAGEKKFGKAQEALVHYSNTLAAIQYTSGLITAHQFYSMVGGWQNYVPTERIFDEDEPYTVGKADSQKRKTGSKRRTLSPLQKIAANTEVFLQQAERNKVKLEVAEMVRLGGFGEILAETSKGDNRGKTIHFRENGKMKYIATPDESIVRALESIQTSSDANVVMQALKTMGSFMRAFYTGRNPEFILGNMWRDLQDAYIHNKFAIGKNPFPVLIDIWSNAVSGFLQSAGVKTKTKDYREFLAYGGTQSGFLTETADTTGRKIEQLGLGSRGEEYRKSPYRAMRQLWRDFCAVAEATENATRYSTFKHSKAELAKQHGGTASILDKKLAALAARDASVDFAKAGSTMRPINRVLLFSNAAVQSIALWGNTIEKAFKSSEGRKELAGKVFKLAMMAVAPALLQFAGNYSDDDRRKRYNALHDWQKNTYWVLGTDIFGQSIRIPKGMDMGIKIFSALTEEFLAHVAGDKPDSAKRIWKTFKDTLPSITTTIFTPAVETYMNYSIFKDAPIVPYGEQDDPKYKQYGIHTSPFSKFLGRAFNQSPRQLDHLIAGYGGALGTYISLGSDGVYGLRKFFFDPYKNPRVVQDYYEALDKQQELLDTYKQRRQDGEKVELPEEYDRALHARLKGVQEQMRKISKAEKKLVDNPKLSDREKEEKLRELEKKRVALCERVLNRAR